MNNTFELIPLTVEAKGEIITNNLPEFRKLVREALGKINRELKTDEDFEQADKDVKALKGAEDAVRSAAVKAFDEKLKELVDGLNETAEEIREPRLEIEKLIAKRKEQVKADLIAQAMDKLECAPRLRETVYGRSVADAIKGKQKFASMTKALETIVNIHNGVITRNRAMIESFAKTHGAELVPDREELETRSPDSVEPELRRRFEMKKAEEEKKRLEEEAEKAKAEAKAAIQQAEAAAKPVNPTLPVPTRGNLAPKPEQGPWQGTQKATVRAAPALTEDAEWQDFCAKTLDAFKPLKAAKEGLKFPKNIAKAQIFANGVNATWKEVM